MICSASDFSSSGFSGAVSSATRSPFTRMVAGRPTLSSKSEPLRCTICVIACLKLNAGRLLCVASPMRIHPEKGLSELHRLRVLRGDFPDHPGDLGLDLVHDLHRLDDAHHLPHGHAAPDLDVRLRPGLTGLVEPAHRRGLDLEELGARGWGLGAGGRWSGCARMRDDHVPEPRAPNPHGIAAVAGFGHSHRRPCAEQTAADLDGAHLRRAFQDLRNLGDDVELHTLKILPPRPYTSSTSSVRPSVSSTGPSGDRCTSSSIRTPPLPAMYTPGSIVTTAFSGNGSLIVRASRGASWTSSPSP